MASNTKITLNCRLVASNVHVCAGCQRVLERPTAALVGTGLVHGPVVTYHTPGSVVQLPDCSPLCGALGSPPPAVDRSLQQSAERAASCSHLPGGHLLQVCVDNPETDVNFLNGQ